LHVIVVIYSPEPPAPLRHVLDLIEEKVIKANSTRRCIIVLHTKIHAYVLSH